MLRFETYEDVPKMQSCIKKPIPVHAVQIMEEFKVNSMEGDYALGKAGDYLMKGIDGEMYICDKSIFERSYNWI